MIDPCSLEAFDDEVSAGRFGAHFSGTADVDKDLGGGVEVPFDDLLQLP